MFRFLKIGTSVILLCLVFYGIYLADEIFSARKLTVEKIIPMLSNPNFQLKKTDLSPRQLEILLKVEDPTFFSHNGMDLSTPGAGITTITQGLVKLLYFDKFKPGIAKIKQTLIAVFALNSMVSKDEQLQLFLQLAYFGTDENKQPILGFSRASQAFFQIEFSQLNEDQFISLVATLIAPAIFSPLKNQKMNSDRVEKIKKLITGEYVPRGLFDVYYGKIPQEFQKDLAPASYFESYYE